MSVEGTIWAQKARRESMLTVENPCQQSKIDVGRNNSAPTIKFSRKWIHVDHLHIEKRQKYQYWRYWRNMNLEILEATNREMLSEHLQAEHPYPNNKPSIIWWSLTCYDMMISVSMRSW